MAALQETLNKQDTPPLCSFPQLDPLPEVGRTCFVQQKTINYSSYKLRRCARLIEHKHLYDAIEDIQTTPMKGGKILGYLVRQAYHNAKNKGLDPDLVFVKTILIGRKLGRPKLDIKGRGRTGTIHKVISNVKITFEEKPLKDYAALIIQGKTPRAASETLKRILFQSQGHYDNVAKLSQLTTRRGRYYRRSQYKRLVQLIVKENKKSGTPITKKKVEKNLLTKYLREFQERADEGQKKSLILSSNLRKQHYEKNYNPK